MIDRERLIIEKQNNKASAEGARLLEKAMLLRDIFKFTKLSLDAFVLLDSSAVLAKGQEISPNSINVDFYKNKLTQSTRLTCHVLSNEVCFDC